jgi:hypothetical protein
MVDEILRKKNGIDFETATSVQGYILQLLETCKGGPQSEPLKANRRKVRIEIVKRAQMIWERINVKPEDNEIERTGNYMARNKVFAKKMIVHARQRWAPTSVLPKFLFAARLLSSSSLWLPYDSDEQWLVDPTFELKTSREVLRAGGYWIDQKARKMIHDLVVYQPYRAVTTWVKATEEWHVQRIKQDLYSGRYLNFEYGGIRRRELSDPPTAENNRLDVIAKKLRIDPLFPVGTLTDYEKKMAVSCFNEIVIQRCAGCPFNNLLIIPGGLKEIVRHYSVYHPQEFWLQDQWTIRG